MTALLKILAAKCFWLWEQTGGLSECDYTKTFQPPRSYSNDESFRSNKSKCWLRVKFTGSYISQWLFFRCHGWGFFFNNKWQEGSAGWSSGMGWWVCAVWGSIGDGAFVSSYGQGMLSIRSHPHSSTGVSNTTLVVCCGILYVWFFFFFSFPFFPRKLDKLMVSQCKCKFFSCIWDYFIMSWTALTSISLHTQKNRFCLKHLWHYYLPFH